MHQHPDARIEELGESASFGAANCLETMESATDFGLQWTSDPTQEAAQSNFHDGGNLGLPTLSSSQDFPISEFEGFNPMCNPPKLMSFLDRCLFLDNSYNSHPDPDLITTKEARSIAQEVGLSMDEVDLWFGHEKLKRVKLFASFQQQAKTSTCQFAPSPESTRAPSKVSTASSSYNDSSPATSSQSLGASSTFQASMGQEILALPKPRRGRPSKAQVKTVEAKRRKISVKYPCLDCENFFAIERWAEHIDRSHFPENVWECPKINRRTQEPCSSNPSYRPCYRHDNFAAHLEREHGCLDLEIADLKKTCKFEVTDFFHKVCGFCNKCLKSRDESLEHIKEHFRKVSQKPNPPIDLGRSLWEHKCGSEHTLQIGIHYRRNRASKADPMDQDQDYDNEDDDGDDGGSGEGNSDNPRHDGSDFRQNNNNQNHHPHHNDRRSGGDGSDNQGHGSLGPFESYNVDQVQDAFFVSKESKHAHATKAITSTKQLQKLPAEEDATFQRHVTGCGRYLRRGDNFKARVGVRDISREYQFPCRFKECVQKFVRKTDLETHYRNAHIKKRNYRCDYCSHLFAEEDSLRRHVEDGCPKGSNREIANKVSIADNTSFILSHHLGGNNKEADFPLDPDPSKSMSRQQGTQEVQLETPDFDSCTMYAEVPSFAYLRESPKLRAEDPSKYSTTPGRSVVSSAIGPSPPIHGRIAPALAWTTNGLSLGPCIVGSGGISNSQDYSFPPVENFALDISPSKTVQIPHTQYTPAIYPRLAEAEPSSFAVEQMLDVKSQRRGRRKPTRVLTEQGKQDALRIRRSGGACVACTLSKKLCTIASEGPCDGCMRLVTKSQIWLPAVICYRRNFVQVVSHYTDFFGVIERTRSIESAIESMHGMQSYLFLGNGLRSHGEFISVDVDSSNVLLVNTQLIKPTAMKIWVSTQTSDVAIDASTVMGTFTETAYAIVPGSLPTISDLDSWGRTDILQLATKWPDSLEAAYDSAFLKYCNFNPPLACHDIVDATMRIVSLGKCLDSRRPIDHNKITDIIGSCLSNPPLQFGIKEFNKISAEFQLSMVARTQLYILAARGIEETQQILGKAIDRNFARNREGRTKDNFLIIGACLRRLALEYRQRLERYRCFSSSEFDERIQRCLYMYTFLTRIYGLWYQGNTLPISPTWNIMDFSQGLGNSEELMSGFSKISFLEREFCKTRLNEDDKFYKELIVGRVLGRLRGGGPSKQEK